MRATQARARAETASVAPWAQTLTGLAEAAIDRGLAHNEPPRIHPADYPPPLAERRGAFVTLRDAEGALRGCIGRVEGRDPLVVAVAECAFGAAFRDPRFCPLTAAERPGLAVKISVLTPLEAVPFRDETELVACLEPGRDGVLIDTGDQRGTLLPAVWQQIPEPDEFWLAVKRKAGLPLDALPPATQVYRYRAEEIA